MVALPDLPGGDFGGEANAVSGDGSVIVGVSDSGTGVEAFRWTATGGIIGLGDLPGGNFFSVAEDVSADGSVVVGLGASASGAEAFRWTESGGMVGLGDLPGGRFESTAEGGVSADGSVVVGYSDSAAGQQAFIWTAERGMESLRDALIAGGATGLEGWNLTRATGVSADGRTIVGIEIVAFGRNRAWIATFPPVPEPSALLLSAFGMANLLVVRRRVKSTPHSPLNPAAPTS
jgi:probable HAF family extracellular repeat protein